MGVGEGVGELLKTNTVNEKFPKTFYRAKSLTGVLAFGKRKVLSYILILTIEYRNRS